MTENEIDTLEKLVARLNELLQLEPNKKIAQTETVISEEELPGCFICSITNEPMKDPVTLSSGHTYEKTAIEDWLKNHDTCPNSGEVVTDKTNLKTNVALKNALEAHIKLYNSNAALRKEKENYANMYYEMVTLKEAVKNPPPTLPPEISTTNVPNYFPSSAPNILMPPSTTASISTGFHTSSSNARTPNSTPTGLPPSSSSASTLGSNVHSTFGGSARVEAAKKETMKNVSEYLDSTVECIFFLRNHVSILNENVSQHAALGRLYDYMLFILQGMDSEKKPSSSRYTHGIGMSAASNNAVRDALAHPNEASKYNVLIGCIDAFVQSLEMLPDEYRIHQQSKTQLLTIFNQEKEEVLKHFSPLWSAPSMGCTPNENESC